MPSDVPSDSLARYENRVYPAVWFAAAAIAQRLLPSRPRTRRRTLAAAFLTGTGAAIGGWAVLGFLREGTTVDPLEPTAAEHLVTEGPFRVSRNPMYLAMALALAAHASWRGTPAALAPLAGFVAVMTRLQIVPEERAMRERFGSAYDAYTARVRRWI